MIPSSGAEHTYFLTAFGHLPAFLFAWVSIIILKPAMLAIICLSFSKYLVEAFTSECEPPLMAIQLLGALTIGNYRKGEGRECCLHRELLGGGSDRAVCLQRRKQA